MILLTEYLLNVCLLVKQTRHVVLINRESNIECNVNIFAGRTSLKNQF